MNENDPTQAPQQPKREPPQERAPLIVRVLINLAIGGFVLMLLVFGTCAIMLR